MDINSNIIRYIIACIHEFARKHQLNYREALNYLDRFKGLAFITEHYEAEHLLSLDEAVEDLTLICRNNGGGIQ